MTLYCAIDLHSNNNVPVVIDEQDNVLFQKRLPNSLPAVLNALAPFKANLKAVAVESTFNWYWLVDGLVEHDFKAMRDLLRKRLQLVRQRVSNMLSAQNQIWRSTGINVPTKPLKAADFSVLNAISNPVVQHSIKANLNIILALNEQITIIEKSVHSYSKTKPTFTNLTTIDGIGEILGQTIMLETGDITRFPNVGNFSSYARCVNSSRTSNNKKKGINNTKCGNKYLSWAFVEAAHCIICHNKTAHAFYQRKRSQANGALATKALAHKIARAAFYVMRDGIPFQSEKLFG